MPVCEIKLFPEPVLRKICHPIRQFDKALHKTIKDLASTMESQKHGIGIAAPQIGIPMQVALVDVSARVPGAKRLVLVNPVIRHLDQEKVSREGCMSLPDYTANLKRFDFVILTWQDAEGRFHEGEFHGIEAVCIQHEVDHLQGKLFIDHVASLKRDMIPRPKQSKSL